MSIGSSRWMKMRVAEKGASALDADDTQEAKTQVTRISESGKPVSNFAHRFHRVVSGIKLRRIAAQARLVPRQASISTFLVVDNRLRIPVLLGSLRHTAAIRFMDRLALDVPEFGNPLADVVS